MSLFKSLDNLDDKEIKHENLGITFSTVEYTYKTFLDKLQSENVSDIQVIYEIENHYDKYFSYDGFQNPNTRMYFQGFWTNLKFLEIILKILQQNTTIREAVRIYYNRSICKIAYDYYTEIGNQNIDNPINKYLFDIVEIINNNKILPMTVFMKPIHALFIVMAKYSSFNINECIVRVNEFIIRLGYDFTQKNIIDIYTILYEDESFGTVFNVTMTQIYDLTKLNQTELAVYYRMNHTLMTLVNSMTTFEMIKLLKGYRNHLELFNITEVRFNVKEVAKTEGYDRINNSIEQIELEGIEFK